MCNYTITLKRPCCLASASGIVDLFSRLISYFFVDLMGDDEDDNRGSGR